MDCGPACLKMICRFYGRDISIQLLRETCYVGKEGASVSDIMDAASMLGLKNTAIKVSWERLRDEIPLPCICHWRQNHFVVVYGIKRCCKRWRVQVADPADGLVEFNGEEFFKYWSPDGQSGLCILFEATDAFQEIANQSIKTNRYGFRQIIAYLNPFKKKIASIFATMLLASVCGLLFPFLTQALVDKGIGEKSVSFVTAVLLAQMMLTLGLLANNLIRNRLLLKVTTRTSISLISDFLSKLMRLPISFFDRRHTGDILQRISDHTRIQQFLTGTLLSICVALITFFIYSIVMATYNIWVFLVFLVGTVLYIIWVFLFLKRRKKLDHERFRQSSLSQNLLIQIVSGMQDIKLNNCEEKKRKTWVDTQEQLFRISIKSLNLGQTQEIGSTLIEQLKSITISFIAAIAVIKGEMTLGMMMAIQYVMGHLSAPVSQFISFIQSTQDAAISLERLGEVHGMEDEEPSLNAQESAIPSFEDLRMENVTFQYDGPRSAKVLDNVSIRIPSGKTTAIVGASGSGKTTLLKMLLGFYSPVSGHIYIGNKDLSNYNIKNWRTLCGSVMQDGFIFADTIANNISLSSDEQDMEKVKESARIAIISDWIESLPLQYNTMLGANGHGLSSGQKQRILIARAAYKNPPYLFFDEATNALDSENEYAILQNLLSLFSGKTAVIVAHRLSTIKDADNIIVLHNGRVVEQGTHDSLVSQHGYYYQLGKNQLFSGE